MKKLFSLLLLIGAIFFASCSSCSHKEENVDPLDIPTEFEKNLTSTDTSEVKELIVTYIELVKEQKFAEAAEMVYRQEMQKGVKVPRPLNNDELDRLFNIYKLFPIEDYKIDYLRFREEGLNEVCVTITMQKGKNGQPDATSKMFFNPIYIQSKWFLVLDDSHQGTKTFVPVEKRDSMRKVFQESGSYNGGK